MIFLSVTGGEFEILTEHVINWTKHSLGRIRWKDLEGNRNWRERRRISRLIQMVFKWDCNPVVVAILGGLVSSNIVSEATGHSACVLQKNGRKLKRTEGRTPENTIPNELTGSQPLAGTCHWIITNKWTRRAHPPLSSHYSMECYREHTNQFTN